MFVKSDGPFLLYAVFQQKIICAIDQKQPNTSDPAYAEKDNGSVIAGGYRNLRLA